MNTREIVEVEKPLVDRAITLEQIGGGTSKYIDELLSEISRLQGENERILEAWEGEQHLSNGLLERAIRAESKLRNAESLLAEFSGSYSAARYDYDIKETEQRVARECCEVARNYMDTDELVDEIKVKYKLED